MRITGEQVRHVARLARLGLTQAEVDKFGVQLSHILENIEILNQLDTTDVPPTAQVTGLENVMRNDDTWDGLSQEEALANAPRREGEFFRVQHVFEEGQSEEAP
ncbi:MAG: Asp-tRNA(Asn)/Glu-tRNA(Gln) amidotransferase subunit GatC [Dehalococcoidales bacterium]|nr:Asp-tRNA(Asn)/Glu-tRNA(Gln) amidotransferase subunit GatC [Dehalococcoidales bacterium]